MSVKVHHIAKILKTWRQCGHTETLMEGVKDKRIVLMVSNERYGERLIMQYRLDRKKVFIISYAAIPSSFNYRFDGQNELPMMVDNSFLTAYCDDVDDTINHYRKQQEKYTQKIFELEDKLHGFINGEKYRLLKYDLDKANYTIIQQQYQNSMLKIKYLIEKGRVVQYPYFLVPLTLFLSFYFIMAIYLLYFFLSR